MDNNTSDIDQIIGKIKHFLPSQLSLKDFIHHNTLHAFQDKNFNDAMTLASIVFGINGYLSQSDFIDLFNQNKISEELLKSKLEEFNSQGWGVCWDDLFHNHKPRYEKRVGEVRKLWQKQVGYNFDHLTQSKLYRLGLHFLDQGISDWGFLQGNLNFLEALRNLERHSYISLFLNGQSRAKNIFMNPNSKIEDLLEIIVGSEKLYENYLFDQQFCHPGWSGLVSAIEDFPETLFHKRKITLSEYIFFELCLELDYLDHNYDEDWPKVGSVIPEATDLFSEHQTNILDKVCAIWQSAFEWTCYDQALAVASYDLKKNVNQKKSFQAIFCIDDRECSLRRYVEHADQSSETFGAPGFFGIDFFYHAENSHHLTKLCPAPVTPKHVILEKGSKNKNKKDLHFSKKTHSFWGGLLTSYIVGYWSAFQLFLSIFRPSISPATASSLRHMDKVSDLIYENNPDHSKFYDLQIGYTVKEMSDRLEGLLTTIGLNENFADIIYVVAHGASTINNPHYSAYDCGACSGRPGSINARLLAKIANNTKVRVELKKRGIDIPDSTHFLSALHDTTRDEIEFYDESLIPIELKDLHLKNIKTFKTALTQNSKERSRRFSISNKSAEAMHEEVKLRSVSLFEPRPELNHATNAICIVGRREISKGKFFDRRCFLNSYDPTKDLKGDILANLMKALAPVCGGINLEYYFSRVDNKRLGAGTKLPHNVMGLIAVANGTDGDLKPGLPTQMIEVHDPVRLLFIIEQEKDIALSAVKRNPEVYEWIKNEWIIYTSIDPQNKKIFRYFKGEMIPYELFTKKVNFILDIKEHIKGSIDNLPFGIIGGV